MTQQYLMRSPSSCGPDALAFAASREHSEIDEAWGIDNINEFFDFRDSPWHHWVVLEALDVRFRTLTLAQVLSGDFVSCKVMALIHAPDDPSTIEPEPLTRQHWVVIAAIAAGYVHYYDGVHDTPRRVTTDRFTQYYAAGTPACAYEVGRGNQKTWFWQRLYVWATNMIFGG